MKKTALPSWRRRQTRELEAVASARKKHLLAYTGGGGAGGLTTRESRKAPQRKQQARAQRGFKQSKGKGSSVGSSPTTPGTLTTLRFAPGSALPGPHPTPFQGWPKGTPPGGRPQCRALTPDPLCGPQPPRRLQHPRLSPVSQQESVVVAERGRVLPAAAPLPMALQQARDNVQGLQGRAAPF